MTAYILKNINKQIQKHEQLLVPAYIHFSN